MIKKGTRIACPKCSYSGIGEASADMDPSQGQLRVRMLYLVAEDKNPLDCPKCGARWIDLENKKVYTTGGWK